MNKRFRLGKRDQGLLFGTRIDERLDENHEVYAFERLIERLDLRSIRSAYNQRGGACYDPADMVKILFYGYHCGIRSSRKLARACEETLPFIYLSGDLRIKFRALAEFRVRFEKELKDLFVQIVHLGFDLGLITGETAFQDGTKIRPSASNAGFKPKGKWKEILSEIEADLMKHFDSTRQADESEDELFGQDHPGEGYVSGSRDEMYARIEEAVEKARLEKVRSKGHKKEESEKQKPEEQDNRENDKSEKEETISGEYDTETLEKMVKALSIRRAVDASEGEADTVQINPVDPDSRFIKSKEGINSNYNAQIVTEKSFIVAVDVSNEAADQNQLIDLVNQRLINLPVKPESYFADAGYFAGANLKHLADEKITAYIPERSWNETDEKDAGAFAPRNFKLDPVTDTMECPAGKRLEKTGTTEKSTYRCIPVHCVQCGFRTECLVTKEDQRLGYRSIRRDAYSKYRDEQRLRMESEAGRKAYRQRSADVEPVFGNLKANRGFRHFLVRGKDRVLKEFLWMAGAHNLAWIMRRSVQNT